MQIPNGYMHVGEQARVEEDLLIMCICASKLRREKPSAATRAPTRPIRDENQGAWNTKILSVFQANRTRMVESSLLNKD